MSEEEKEEARVNMVWPATLKDAVRDKVGARGLTPFVLDAVRTKLTGEDRFQVQESRIRDQESEVDKLRWLCQLLADRYAMGGDYEDRVQGLMDVELPSWLSTEGWPAELAKLVPKQDAEPVTVSKSEPRPFYRAPDGGWTADPEQAKQPLETVPPKVEPESAPEEDEDLHRPMALTKPTERTVPIPVAELRSQSACPPSEAKVGPPGERPEVRKLEPEEAGFKLEAAPEGDDFFAKVQAKAAEKGVDLSGANLRSASSIERPEPTPEPELESEPEAEPEVEPEVVDESDKCPNCGDVLVAGECWSCM